MKNNNYNWVGKIMKLNKKVREKGIILALFSISSIFSWKIMQSRIITQISEIQVIPLKFNMISFAYFLDKF